jgi:UDP-N-acetylglucosamine diphosphorylase/glucosamine-1-phosphate N-acetyltransferase
METANRPLKVIVLAGGQGKRLQQDAVALPKVLTPAAGRPLLAWVLDHLSFILPQDTIIVTGYLAEQVEQASGSQYCFARQSAPLGTGHAVAAAADCLAGYTGDVLIAFGDMPLVRSETMRSLIEQHVRQDADATILTAVVDQIPPYGRIIRDSQGRLTGIVEERDCTPEQRLIREVNPSVYVFRAQPLFEALRGLGNNNAQGEYYLTDVPQLMLQAGRSIATVTIRDDRQILGVNTPEDLARCELILQEEVR